MKRRDLTVILFAAGLCLALLILSRSGLLDARKAPAVQSAPDITVSLKRPGEETARELVSLWGEQSKRRAGSAYLRVQVNNHVYEPLPLDSDFSLEIEREGGFHNLVSVEKGAVAMAFSSCDNQLCVHQGQVSMENRDLRVLFNQIVCLPNEVLLEVLDEQEVKAYYGDQAAEAQAAAGADLRPALLGALWSGLCLAGLFAVRFVIRLPLVKRRKP